MTPTAIKAEAAKAGLDVAAIDFPTKSVAGLAITSPMTSYEKPRVTRYWWIFRLRTFSSIASQRVIGRWIDSRARFVSALCLAWPDGHTEAFEARVDGALVWPPRGSHGFGYDPMFQPDGFTLTFGEMTNEDKHGLPPKGRALSHRARAFLQLAEACLDAR